MAAAITDAFAQGQAVIGMIGPGLVAMAALMVGVGLVLKWVGK